MIKATQIRELTADEITVRIAELERERFNLKFRGATQPLEDPLRLRVIRRDVARLKTVLREQQLKQEPKARDVTQKTKAGAGRAAGR
jgi:large subunit ribosomal protein L29